MSIAHPLAHFAAYSARLLRLAPRTTSDVDRAAPNSHLQSILSTVTLPGLAVARCGAEAAHPLAPAKDGAYSPVGVTDPGIRESPGFERLHAPSNAYTTLASCTVAPWSLLTPSDRHATHWRSMRTVQQLQLLDLDLEEATAQDGSQPSGFLQEFRVYLVAAGPWRPADRPKNRDPECTHDDPTHSPTNSRSSSPTNCSPDSRRASTFNAIQQLGIAFTSVSVMPYSPIDIPPIALSWLPLRLAPEIAATVVDRVVPSYTRPVRASGEPVARALHSNICSC